MKSDKKYTEKRRTSRKPSGKGSGSHSGKPFRISRKTILLAAAGASAAAVVITLLCVFLIPSASDGRPGIIALPADGGYEDSWKPLLPEIAKASGCSQVSARSYTTLAELESLLASAEELNLLWAELPLDNAFVNLARLSESGLIVPIDQKELHNFFPSSLIDAVRRAGSQGDALYALPLSYDPWVFVTGKSSPRRVFPYSPGPNLVSLSVPGADDAGALGAYALASGLAGKNDVPGNRGESLALLSSWSDDGRLQQNAYTYTQRDALNLFMDGKAGQCYLPLSSFHALPIEERFELTLAPFPPVMCASVTAAVFPSRNAAAGAMASAFLRKGDVQFKAANYRRYTPATTASYVRNIYTASVIEDAEKSPLFIIPSTLYESSAGKEELVSSVKRALSSNQKK